MKKLSIFAALAAIACAAQRRLGRKNARCASTVAQTDPGQPLVYAVPAKGAPCCDTFPHCGCWRIG